MALQELSAVLRREAGNGPSLAGAAADPTQSTGEVLRQGHSIEQHLEQLAAEVKLLRNGLTTVVEAVDVVQPALQKEVELRGLRDQQVENLELQIKDLRSDLCEILTLKVKPRLASLEKEASETRRRLLLLPTCSVAGEHTGSCRHSRGGSTTFRAASPDGEEWKKAKKELQDIGEALLDRARREMQRQEDLVQSRLAAEHRQQVALDAAGRDISNEARGVLRSCEQSAQQLAEQRAKEVTHAVATDLLKKAETVLQSEIAEVSVSSREANEAALQRLAEQQEANQRTADALASSLQELRRDSQQGTAGLRDGFSKAEKTLRSEVARLSTATSNASQEASCAAQQISRLQAGVRGVEETLERRTQWMRSAKSELEASISEAAASSMSAVARTVRTMSSEVEEHQRGRMGDVARLERFEDATQRQAQAQAKVLDELREAIEATAERRHGEEQNLMKKVHDVLRALKEKVSKEGRETVEAAGRAVAEARSELQQQFLSHAEQHSRRAVQTAREELGREVAALRRDVEEQVREDLRKQMTSLGQDCSVSIETQVKDSLAKSQGRLDRRMEELFRDYRAQERSEVRVIATKTETSCEEQVRQLLWQVEDQTKQAASKTEEGWHLAQTLQERAAAAVNFAEAEAQRLAIRGEAVALEHAQHAEAEALRLAQCGEERAAVAAKLAQAEAQRCAAAAEAETQRLAAASEAKAESLAHLAEEQVVKITGVEEALASRSKEEAAACAKHAEEHAANLAIRVEESGLRCKELMEDLSKSHLEKVESMQDVVKGTLHKMEALEAEYRASLEIFNAMKDQAFAAAQQAYEAQEASAATKRYVEESRIASEKALMEVRSELNGFIDEQRIFCGFIDTEQRSYQELIRQEVNALSRLVDATLRIDRPMSGASPASTLEGLQPFEPIGELPIAFADQVMRSSG